MTELVVEATLDMYGFDALEFLLTCVEKKTPILEALDKELPLQTQANEELKEFLAQLHLRLVAVLRSVGCYDKQGRLLYRFIHPIECGFLLEKYEPSQSSSG